MTNQLATRIAAVAGLLAVALGAFGAHALKDFLGARQTAGVWEKAVFYQFVHAIMLFVLAQQKPLRKGPWFSFVIGILLFSGSLYLLAATTERWIGFVTPFGGLSFLVGWCWLIVRPGRD